MNASELHASSDREVPLGTVVAILPKLINEYWPAVEAFLRPVEGWTELFGAEDIRPCLLDGRMQLWSVLVSSEAKSVFGLTQIVERSRGPVCTLWLIATTLSDEALVSSLIDRCESMARSEGCSVFEINVFPCLADRIAGKVTFVTLERSLRLPRSEVN